MQNCRERGAERESISSAFSSLRSGHKEVKSLEFYPCPSKGPSASFYHVH